MRPLDLRALHDADAQPRHFDQGEGERHGRPVARTQLAGLLVHCLGTEPAGAVEAHSWAAHHDGDKHHDRDGRGKERSGKDEERSDRDGDRKDDDHEGRRKSLDQRVVNEIKQLLA